MKLGLLHRARLTLIMLLDALPVEEVKYLTDRAAHCNGPHVPSRQLADMVAQETANRERTR